MDVIITLILVIASMIVGGLIGALTVYSIMSKVTKKLKSNTKPIGDLYLDGSELFLNLDEDIVDKKCVTLQVIKLNSHK